MTPRDHDAPDGSGRAAQGSGADKGTRGPAGSDPIRDLFLGLAAQIDELASLFAGGPRPAAAGGPGGDAATGERNDLLKDALGEVTSLMSELGDLLARLLAALIAVLEALMRALRSTSAPAPYPGTAPARYQAIEVRFDSPAAQPMNGGQAPRSRSEEGDLP